jgi:hypothetical protein
LTNLIVHIESKFKVYNFHLYIHSKILLQVVLYNGHYQIAEFKSALSSLGVKYSNTVPYPSSRISTHYQINCFFRKAWFSRCQFLQIFPKIFLIFCVNSFIKNNNFPKIWHLFSELFYAESATWLQYCIAFS